MKQPFGIPLRILLFLQIVGAVFALVYGDFWLKCSSAGMGVLILLLLAARRRFATPDIWMVVGAFLFSMVGDYFLSHRGEDAMWFVYGILFFFLAHIGYLAYSLFHGKLVLWMTGGLCTSYLIFFFTSLYDGIGEGVLLWAALGYLFVSCFSLGAAWGIKFTGFPKWGYVFGIVLILYSDTLIAFTEFMEYDRWDFLILPTYYLAHIVITWSVFQRFRAAITIE